MIYLITGVPGSGKTLYALSTLVPQLLKDRPKAKDGRLIERRLLVDGIPDLALNHQLMAPCDIDAKTNAISCDGHGLANWPEWVQPGDVLVVDEVQRYLRPRAMGTKPQPCVTELETHRHKGIDVVFITQNPMLIDQNVRRLVGRHLNVRRIFGGARALIYDWDGCQADVHRTQGATRSVWNYPRSAYKLYTSSEAHTKQRQKFPLWMAFPLVVLALAVFAGPKAYSALSGSMTGKGIATGKPPTSDPARPASAPGAVAASDAKKEPASIAERVAEKVDELAVAGCAVLRGDCKCYDEEGAAVKVEPDFCRSKVGEHGAIAQIDHAAAHALDSSPPRPVSPAELRFLQTVHGDRERRVLWGAPIVPGLTPPSS